MSIGHDYIALLLIEERAARLQQEGALNRTSRVVRRRRGGRWRRAAPVVPLERRDGSLATARGGTSTRSDRVAS